MPIHLLRSFYDKMLPDLPKANIQIFNPHTTVNLFGPPHWQQRSPGAPSVSTGHGVVSLPFMLSIPISFTHAPLSRLPLGHCDTNSFCLDAPKKNIDSWHTAAAAHEISLLPSSSLKVYYIWTEPGTRITLLQNSPVTLSRDKASLPNVHPPSGKPSVLLLALKLALHGSHFFCALPHFFSVLLVFSPKSCNVHEDRLDLHCVLQLLSLFAKY